MPKGRPPGIPQFIMDLDALHELLYARSHCISHTLIINNVHLAAELGTHAMTMQLRITQMRKEGRIIRVSVGKRMIWSYRIVDPEVWVKSRPTETDLVR
jgi:hypothetical protein